MKISYDKEKDILLIESSEDPIDYAEEVGSIIAHFTKEGKPVLLEILDASEFLSEVIKASMPAKEERVVDLAI